MDIVFFSPGRDPAPWLACLEAALPGARVWAWDAGEADRQADYAVIWAPPADLLRRQRHLKAVFNIGAGVDRVLSAPGVAAMLDAVPVIRLEDAGMAVQMAEYVCHALVRHTRGFARYDRQQAAGDWQVHPALDRAAWPVGVMGLGAIGARVAASVAGFDYPVHGWSRSPRPPASLPGVTLHAGPDGLPGFLAAVRALVCLLPLTPETAGILSADTFARLKPGAFVVNVARGQHLVEKDLLAALASGQVAAAQLDVFADEPLPAGHPFWTHPAVTVTPHISAITLKPESARQIAANIARIEAGRAPLGRVDASRGY